MALNNITSLSTALSGSLTGGSLGVFSLKLPSSLYSLDDHVGVTSLSGIVDQLSTLAADAIQMTNTAICAFQVITNPAMALNILNEVTKNIATYAVEMAHTFATLLGNQIRMMFARILGTAINLVNGVLGIITELFALYNNLVSIWKTITNMSFEWSKMLKDEAECESLFASIASCYLNKLFGEQLREFEYSVSSSITEFGNDMNTALANGLNDTNVIGNYLNQEAFALQKVNTQIKSLNGIINKA